MLRRSLELGSLLALVLLSPVWASVQQRNTEPPKITRKANAALQGSATNRVEAVYPPAAAAAGIFGTVLVEVAVDEAGNVTSARALSGHPLLQEAASNAARYWTFKPTLVQGKPVNASGTLTFTFKLPEHVLRNRSIERLKKQISINPDNPKLHYQLGTAYRDSEQFADALQAYERAVALRPKYGAALLALGDLYMKLNRPEEALNAYNRAVVLVLAPEMMAASYRNIALIHFRRGKFQEAVEPFKRAIALAPEGSMYLNLGLTYLNLGDKASALVQYGLLKEWNSILAEQLLKQINESP